MAKTQQQRIVLGLKVRQFRQERGWNFEEMSKRTGISVSYLNEIEKGKKYPQPENIQKLAGALGLDLSLYRANVNDGITLEFDEADFVFVQRNVSKIRRQGVELLLDYTLGEHVSLYGSGAFNDAENRDTKETVRDQGVARQHYTFGARYSDGQGWGANLYGYYNRWSSSPSHQANDRKPIFDLKLTKRFEEVKNEIDLELFFNIHNLTNSKYWADISFPLAERYFEGGFSIHF